MKLVVDNGHIRSQMGSNPIHLAWLVEKIDGVTVSGPVDGVDPVVTRGWDGNRKTRG